MIGPGDLGSSGLIALLASAFTTGAHWALSYYKGGRNSNGSKSMQDWQMTKDREIITLQTAIQANTVAVASLNGTITHGVLPRIENLERSN